MITRTRCVLVLTTSVPSGYAPSLLSFAQNGCKWTAMRHGNKKAKLGRPADQRKALLRSLTTELLRHGKIKTTKVFLSGNQTTIYSA